MQDGVVCLASRIFNGGEYILFLQEGIVRQNFFIGSPGREEIQNVGNAQAKASNARAASALSFFHRYPLQPFVAHEFEVYDGLTQRARPRTAHAKRLPEKRAATPSALLRRNIVVAVGTDITGRPA